jgi:hypothetical protein
VQCRGIAALTPAVEINQAPEPTKREAFKSMDLQTFMKTFRKTQYDEYQSAILALDKPKLKALQSEGIPGKWTSEAIKKIGSSTLSLPEKRRRTAWIFSDHAQLARALSSDVMESLLDWLPREDWRPVFDVITRSAGTYYGLEYLREHAQSKGHTRLACDIDHARSLICGETWGANR